MGVSTDGQIFFGFVFEEGFEFPWPDYDVEDWWRERTGYRPPFELFTPEGDYLDKDNPPPDDKVSAYFGAARDWDKAHPLPFELVNVCSEECPQWALAVPGSVTIARRGYPEAIDPLKDFEVDAGKAQALIDFCAEHKIALSAEQPSWFLASFWG